MTEVWMPKDVRHYFDHITDGTGQAPEVEKIGDRRFRLTVANERVRMTMDMKMTRPGKWVWAASALWVDGQRHDLAENPAAFYRLFADPDSDGKRRVDPAEEESYEPYPLDDPPPVHVQTMVGRVSNLIEKKGAEATVRAGRLVDGTPLVEITTAHGYLRVKLGAELAVRAVRDGIDITGDAKTTLDEMFARLTDTHDPAAPGRARPRPARQRHAAQHRCRGPSSVRHPHLMCICDRLNGIVCPEHCTCSIPGHTDRCLGPLPAPRWVLATWWRRGQKVTPEAASLLAVIYRGFA